MIRLPYHKGSIYLNPDGKHIKHVLVSGAHEYVPSKAGPAAVEDALDSPVGGLRLEDLARGKKDMVLITSDHTRPVPSHITLPVILRRVRQSNPGIKIKIIVATGTHRAPKRDEMIAKFGVDIVQNETIINHDARDKSAHTSLGTLDTGLRAEVNKLIIKTDLLIAEGFIEPHFFAGFSGGRKSVFPGVASLECVMANHCAEYIANPYARTGSLINNPIHEEALEVAGRAGLRFILNVVINQEKQIVKAFAGHFDEAHKAGCAFVQRLSEVEAPPADIVVTTNGGYPMDQNIYQAVKGMTAAEAACKKGGVIIIAAGCADGHGGDGFYDIFKHARSPREVTGSIIGRNRFETVPDQWQAQILARVLENHKVILVSDMADKKVVEDMFMTHAPDIETALEAAARIMGGGASITVIPDGVSVIVKRMEDRLL